MNEWKEIAENALETMENIIENSAHYELMASSPSYGDKFIESSLIIQEKETGINIHIIATIEEEDVTMETKEAEPMDVNATISKWLKAKLMVDEYVLELNEIAELKNAIAFVENHDLTTANVITGWRTSSDGSEYYISNKTGYTYGFYKLTGYGNRSNTDMICVYCETKQESVAIWYSENYTLVHDIAESYINDYEKEVN